MRSDHRPSGAMATPPTAATSCGHLSTPFETSPTTRVTDTLERMMAQGVGTPPQHRPCPTVAISAAAAPPRERAQLGEPDVDRLGQPQGPIAKRGLTDGLRPRV